MIPIRTLLPVLFSIIGLHEACAQIAIGQWRDHFSYTQGVGVTTDGSNIYCASPTGVFKYDRGNGEIERYTKVNALSDVGINGLDWNSTLGLLFVSYSNGNIDLLQGSSSHNMGDIKRSDILGDKSINNVHFEGSTAYLSCGFGIVVIDLERREVRETWLIGPGGSQVEVHQLTMSPDSIYAATGSGLLVASRNAANLASFTSWRPRTDMGAAMAEGPFNAVAWFNDRILVNYDHEDMDADTVLILQPEGTWAHLTELFGRETKKFNLTDDGNWLVTVHRNDVSVLDTTISIANQAYNYVPTGASPAQAILGPEGHFWIADQRNGLIRSVGATDGNMIVPNGPRTSTAYRMDMHGGALFVATGAVAGNWSNMFSKDGVHHYANGEWRTNNPDNTPLMQGGNSFGGATNDVMAVAVDPNDPTRAFAGSWDEGLIEFHDRQPVMVYNPLNSTLLAPPEGPEDRANVAGLDFDEQGNLWMTNGNSSKPLAVYTRNGSWYSFGTGSLLNGNYLVSDVLAASNGYKWVIRPRGNSLFVYNDNGTIADSNDDQYKLIRNVPGEGGLPSPDVYSIAEDLDGEIWVGTNEGVCVFYTPSAIFSGGDYDAQQILIEQDGNVQILLETEAISAIAVDGADRKWIGTQTSGIYLVSPDGREQIHHFTEQNSPLPSNGITSIAIDEVSGEVFIGTEKGIIGFRSDATGSENGVECASVFPNPARADHAGPIAITGLMRDSEVKITDMSGDLVYRTTSLGGTASWPGTDMEGNRVSTGVYLIFASDRGGTYKCNTKVLVVR